MAGSEFWFQSCPRKYMTPGVTVPSPLTLDFAIIRNPLVATPDTLVRDAIGQMAACQTTWNQAQINEQDHTGCQNDRFLDERSTCVIVVDAGQVVGLLTGQDVVRLTAQQLSITELTLQQVVDRPKITLPEANLTDAATLLALLQQHHTRHLPLVNESHQLVGLATQATLQHFLQLQRTTALSAIPDYLFRVDANGVYREVVTYKPDITLFQEDLDPVGLSMTDVLPEEVAIQQLSYLEETLQTSHMQTYEQQVQRNGRLRDEEVRVIRCGDDEALFMIRDISDRKQAERQLQNLIEGTAAKIGQDFFPALVGHIAAALEVNHVAVCKLVDDQMHTLAFWTNGRLHSSITFPIEKTPCERVMQDGRFYCSESVQQHFPDDIYLAEMQAESYLGVALYDGQGNMIGELCILDHRPIRAPQRAERILQAFAARATAELERQRTTTALEQLNQTLETKVLERTAALQEREQFLQTVLDTFPTSVFWKDLNSVYLGCNHNFLKDAGLSVMSEMVGKTDYDMPWGADHAVHAQMDDRQVMESDTAKLNIEETLVKANREQIQIETNKMPLHDLSGKVVGVLGIYQDITVRKQLELELKNSQQRLREVLDSAIAGIIRLRLYPDMSIQYDYISPHRAAVLGYTVEELLSLPDGCQTLVEPADWTHVILPWIEAILENYGQSTHQVEYQLRRKDGSRLWVLANCYAQWNAVDGYWDVTNVETDISDRKKAESQLQNLILGTAAVGQDFFPALVRHIAEALEVAHVFAVECIDNTTYDLAVWSNGKFQASDSPSPLINTPCERTLQAGIYHCEHSVQREFPDCLTLPEIGAESYLGIALRDTHGDTLGVLHILHHSPLQAPERAQQILQIFAARAAAELERQRANNALKKLNQALEIRVAERTAELQERKQFLQTVLDTFPLHIFWKDKNSVYLGGNKQFLARAGFASVDDIKGKTDYDLPWTTVEASLYRANDRQVIETNAAKLGLVETQLTADGHQTWTEVNKLPLHNLEGEVIGVLGTYQDVTERIAAQTIIKQQLAAMEAAIDGIGILQNDAYIYVNQAHLTLFGFTQPEELLGRSWQTIYSPQELARLKKEVLPVLKRDRAWQGENIATRKDGSTFPQGVSLTLMDDGLLICVCRDISALKQAQAQINHNALHDPLTGLPNRRMLVERIELAIHRSQRHQSYQYALLFLDLDRFKVINDSLGHMVGDKLLIEVSKRLKAHVRNTDMVARFGGDEFVILLEDVGSVEDILQVSERILADCQIPIVIDEHKIFTSTSIGIVLGSESYHEASALIRDADIAMYRAKVEENNSYKFFDAAMHVEAMGRLTLETDLRKAVGQQELEVYYQPIVNLLEGSLVGFEALARWQHPIRGLMVPSEFIPIAEETGLVMSVDSWIIGQACKQLLHWQQKFPLQALLKISINLSAQGLHRRTLLEDIDHLLESISLNPKLITLEITESMLIEDIEQTIELLTQLASRQIQISIDDFGTGYSSLSYLHRLPVHNLKIDRSFVGHMHLENRNYQVVNTILALSKQLGLTVVAEGIEAAQHVQQLQQLGCELGQGYLFSQPLTAHQVETILSGGPRNWLSIPVYDSKS